MAIIDRSLVPGSKLAEEDAQRQQEGRHEELLVLEAAESSISEWRPRRSSKNQRSP